MPVTGKGDGDLWWGQGQGGSEDGGGARRGSNGRTDPAPQGPEGKVRERQ